jgi:hypothetical protein
LDGKRQAASSGGSGDGGRKDRSIWDTDDSSSSSSSVDGAPSGEDAEEYGPPKPAAPGMRESSIAPNADLPPMVQHQAYLSLPESSGGVTDEINFWAGFGAIESQGVALRFVDNEFYFGTVVSADDRDKTVSIIFNDKTEDS